MLRRHLVRLKEYIRVMSLLLLVFIIPLAVVWVIAYAHEGLKPMDSKEQTDYDIQDCLKICKALHMELSGVVAALGQRPSPVDRCLCVISENE